MNEHEFKKFIEEFENTSYLQQCTYADSIDIGVIQESYTWFATTWQLQPRILEKIVFLYKKIEKLEEKIDEIKTLRGEK